MNRSLLHGMVLLLTWLLLGASFAPAKTSNGNDFALFYSEAKTDQEQKAVADDAMGRPHYFRYLTITKMEEGETNGIYYVTLDTIEPASRMNVKFTVTKSESLQKLKDDPETKVGDALGVTGKIASVDKKSNLIVLNPVIVRHKDRRDPKVGKEMLYEIDSSATYYSFTGGKRPVNVSYRDRDLLEFKDKILSTQGKDAWAEFLVKEIAKREKARAAERAARNAADKEKKDKSATPVGEGQEDTPE